MESCRHACRSTISRLLIVVLLLAQFAVASYACPVMRGAAPGSPDDAVAAVPAAMPTDCDAMDMPVDGGPSALCIEHCRYGQQSADVPHAGLVYATLPALLYALPMLGSTADGSGANGVADAAPTIPKPPPPHCILHCVFRI